MALAPNLAPPGPSGGCSQTQNPRLTKLDQISSLACISEPQWKLVENKQNPPKGRIPPHTRKFTPQIPREFPGSNKFGNHCPEHLTHSTGQGTRRPEYPGSHSMCGFLTPGPVRLPRSPPEDPLVSTALLSESLKPPSSTLSAVAEWVLQKMRLGGIGKSPSEPILDTHSALQRHLLADFGIASVPCSIRFTEAQALGLACLLFDSG